MVLLETEQSDIDVQMIATTPVSSDEGLLASNPLGKIPALVDGDFRTSQSGAIQTYITEKTGKFGGETQEER